MSGRWTYGLMLLLLATVTCDVAPERSSGAALYSRSDDAFTFFAIGDTRTYPNVFEQVVRSMTALDPNAVAIINSGDLTADGDSGQWQDHMNALRDGSGGRARADITDFSPDAIRYIGLVGNHDQYDGDWYSNWNRYLPGQKNLGENSRNGIYFSFTYKNALFIILDSEHPSSSQTSWLRNTLQSADESVIDWKFAFFHSPVYPCNSKSPFDEGIDWVREFETYEVDIAFVAHSHTYERTCPMIGGRCQEGGVIYLNSSAAGASGRSVDRTKSDRAGGDSYSCSEILEDSQGDWRHYCHIAIDGTALTQKCYSRDSTSSPRFEFTLEKEGGSDGGEGGEGNGLLGTYYDDIDLVGEVLTRLDPTVNFSWGEESPDPLIGADAFSVRWEGEVEAPGTGDYTFYTRSDDGVRLWVDGNQLIDNWTDHSPTEDSYSIALQAAQRYPIQVEYYESGGNATMQLRWKGPDIGKNIVPQSRLYYAEAPTDLCPDDPDKTEPGDCGCGVPEGTCGPDGGALPPVPGVDASTVPGDDPTDPGDDSTSTFGGGCHAGGNRVETSGAVALLLLLAMVARRRRRREP